MRVSLRTLLLLHGWYDRKATRALKKYKQYQNKGPVAIYDSKTNKFEVFKCPT
jgi:hypothetical protein